MGKKTKRKIRWRRLSLDESSLTDSSLSGPEGEANGSNSSEESSVSSRGDRSNSGGVKTGLGQGHQGQGNNRNNRNRRPGNDYGNNVHQHGHQHGRPQQGHQYFGHPQGQQHNNLFIAPHSGMFSGPTSPNYFPNPAMNYGMPRPGNNGHRRQGQGPGQGQGHGQNWNRRQDGRRQQGPGSQHYDMNYPNHLNNPACHQQQRGHHGQGHGHHGQYPGNDKRFMFVAETCYFNNKEYTKIQTPHQDLLFKKGWLSSRKKDLDGLNIPDRSAEVQKLAQEYRNAEQKKADGAAEVENDAVDGGALKPTPAGDRKSSDENGDAQGKNADKPQIDSESDIDPNSTQGLVTSSTSNSSPEPPVRDFLNDGNQPWIPDPSLCGDYYNPTPALLIPCELTDHMGQSYPAMMVQHPFYAPVQWAVVPVQMPLPYMCYDQMPPMHGGKYSSTSSSSPTSPATSTATSPTGSNPDQEVGLLTTSMSSLEITEILEEVDSSADKIPQLQEPSIAAVKGEQDKDKQDQDKGVALPAGKVDLFEANEVPHLVDGAR